MGATSLRFGAIVVPIVIAGSIGIIVASELGWFTGPAAEPVLIRADVGPDAVRTAFRRAAGMEPEGHALPVTGRSTSATRPSGPDAVDVPPAASVDALAKARDEAAKARQDVVDVTRASIEAQAATESDFSRREAELDGEIATLKSDRDARARDLGASNEASRRLQSDLASAREKTAALEKQLVERAGDAQVTARQRDDLDGARRDVDALRQENAALQRDLAGAKTAEALASEPKAGRSVADGRTSAELATALRRAEAEIGKLHALRAHDAAQMAKLHRAERAIGAASTRVAPMAGENGSRTPVPYLPWPSGPAQ